jgi:hypothetical protein
MNSLVVDQTISVVDTTAPTFNAPSDMSVACSDDTSDLSVTGDVMDASDACSASVTVTYNDNAGDSNCFAGDVIVRTWTATDACGNASSADQIISLVDDVAPYFTSVPADTNLECGDVLPMDMATAEDVCSGVTVTVADSEDNANCTGMAVIIRTFTATDGCGNSATAVQTITRVDTESPSGSITDETLTCDSYDATADYGTAEATDNCMSAIVIAWSEVSSTQEGSNGCFVVEREYTFTDGCGNSSSAIQTITVTDDVAPVMDEVASAVELQCGDAMPATPGATDNCSAVEVTFEDVETTIGCSGEMNFIRTYTATDACGNSVSATQEVTYNDIIAPTFTVPADVTVECDTDLSDLDVTGDVMDAADVCSADIVISYDDSYGEASSSNSIASCDLFADGPNATWQYVLTSTTADDENSNQAQTLEISMVSVPEGGMNYRVAKTTANGNWFFGPSQPLEVGMNSVTVAGVAFNRSVKFQFSSGDGEFDSLAINGEMMNDCLASDSCLADNIVTRTWTVTDGCGNAASAAQVITLEDTTAPVVIYEANITLYDSASENIDDFEGISEVYDACSDYTYTTTDIYSGSGIYGYQLNRTMVFTDACGNSTTIEQLVTAIYSTGCTYADALNYDEAAIIDDGSCVYEGCTDMASANYNPIASVDDGSCVTVGCMDPAGYDFDPNANFPGGCDYPDPCPGDINDDGTVNVSDLLEFFQLYGVDCPE